MVRNTISFVLLSLLVVQTSAGILDLVGNVAHNLNPFHPKSHNTIIRTSNPSSVINPTTPKEEEEMCYWKECATGEEFSVDRCQCEKTGGPVCRLICPAGFKITPLCSCEKDKSLSTPPPTSPPSTSKPLNSQCPNTICPNGLIPNPLEDCECYRDCGRVDCPSGQVLDRDSCKCEANLDNSNGGCSNSSCRSSAGKECSHDEPEQKCPEGFVWDPDNCECYADCSDTICSEDFNLDMETCDCIPKPEDATEKKKKCQKKECPDGKVFDEEVCDCVADPESGEDDYFKEVVTENLDNKEEELKKKEEEDRLRKEELEKQEKLLKEEEDRKKQQELQKKEKLDRLEKEKQNRNKLIEDQEELKKKKEEHEQACRPVICPPEMIQSPETCQCVKSPKIESSLPDLYSNHKEKKGLNKSHTGISVYCPAPSVLNSVTKKCESDPVSVNISHGPISNDHPGIQIVVPVMVTINNNKDTN